jgi:hypothetical protein
MPIWQPRQLPDEPPNQEDLLVEADLFAARLHAPSPRLVRPQIAARSSALSRIAAPKTQPEDEKWTAWRVAA